MNKDFVSVRDLFWQLTFREIKARYKQSVLGYAWAVLVPLLHLAVLSIVFSQLFKVPTEGVPYPIFLFVALVPWLFLINSITAATSSIIANSTLITKVSLPREIIPIAAISSKLIDLALTVLVLTIFLIIYQVKFQPSLVLVPLIFLVQLALTIGISLILSATNVFFRDIENILGVFLTIWMYLSPVIYPSTLVPGNFQFFFYLNPMAGILNAYREVILSGGLHSLSNFIYSTVFSLMILVTGLVYFRRRAKYFADVI